MPVAVVVGLTRDSLPAVATGDDDDLFAASRGRRARRPAADLAAVDAAAARRPDAAAVAGRGARAGRRAAAGQPAAPADRGLGGAAGPLSAIIWGPPGTGKTTLAHLVATAAGRRFVELSAVTAGVKDVRAVMDRAARERDLYDRQTVLFLDEIHRFTKAQQDALLPGVENRLVILVAATTENPSFSVIAPLLSRSMLITLGSLADDELADVLAAALDRRPGPRRRARARADDAGAHLVRIAGGDARRALTSLEAAAGVALDAAPAGRTGDGPVADHARPRRAGRRPRGGALRPGRRPALRRGQRADQVDARQRRRRRAALPRPDARGGGGPPVHRAPHRHLRERGRRHGRPDGAADRRRRDARRRPDRHAGGADHPGAGGGPQRARAQVATRLPRHQRGDRRRPGRAGRRRAAAPARQRVRRRRPPRARRGLRLRPRRARRGGRAAVPARTTCRAVRDYYRPTDRGFEERLGPRWKWLRELIRGR